MDHTGLDVLARRQLGLVTTRQLHELGLSDDAILHHVREGRLVRVRRGVLRSAGAPVTRDQAWLAAVIASGDDAVLSHESAASAWMLRGFDPPGRIDVLVPRQTPPRIPGVRGHITNALPEGHRTRLGALPITTVERTLVDVCGTLPLRTLGRSVDDALRRKLITLPGLVRCLDEVPVSGRRRSVPMRDVLRVRVPGYDPGGSDRELDVLTVLADAGIDPLPEQQHRVTVGGRSYKLDYAWPDSRHAIEYDGEGHASVSAFHDDRERWRRLQRAGWTVWHVTAVTPRDEIVAIGVAATHPIA